MTYDPSIPINVQFMAIERYTDTVESDGAPIL